MIGCGGFRLAGLGDGLGYFGFVGIVLGRGCCCIGVGSLWLE